MQHAVRFGFVVALAAAVVQPVRAQGVDRLVDEGTKLLEAGESVKAQERFEAAVKADPKSFEAHYALGRVLDLNGQYAEARTHLETAGAIATEPERKEQVTSAIAVSYAFERKPDEAARYYQRIFDRQMEATALDDAAATANAIGRVYLESGNPQKAEEWYRTGYETARQIPQLKSEELDLWDFRWHHAQARIAARRGDVDAAWKHAADARAKVEKGTIEEQRVQLPYLEGYVALYAKDYGRAVKELSAADQRDPFVLGLLAKAHDALGHKGQAAALHRRVLSTSSHNINAAFSRPEARRYLEVP
jgi:tetratricopeptide (TPR) repeat protein